MEPEQTQQQQKSSQFTHVFSGWSIWIEPTSESDSAKNVTAEMKTMADKCGGEGNGVYFFAPHCTLLYNFNASRLVELDGNEGLSDREIGKKMLQECRHLYHHHREGRSDDDGDETIIDNEMQAGANKNTSPPNLIPTSFHFFPYPKEADNGKGFACVIPFLLLLNTPN